MQMLRGRIIPAGLILIFLITLIQLDVSEGKMTGPVVTVDIAADMVHAGGSIGVVVNVEDYDGESYTPMDLVEVTLSAEIGTYSPESAITDVDGICYFEYYAPEDVDGPTDVTITAIAEQGVLDPTGTDEVKVTYHLEGVILGPTQVLAGGKSENYILQVTAGGEPVQGINVMPTVFGAGTLGTFSRTTNATGEAVLILHPGDTAGQISMIIQINSEDYFASAASMGINVVEELGPLELILIGFSTKMDHWGCRTIRTRVVRGSDPVIGADVHFTSDLGYFIQEDVSSDINGYANTTFIASAEYDYTERIDFTLNISANDGIEVAYVEEPSYVEERGVPGAFNKYENYFEMYMKTLPEDDSFKGQLFPGESLVHQPRIIDDSDLYHYNPYMVDMILDFELYGPDNELIHQSTLEEGIDTFSEEGDREDYILNLGKIPVYQVPNNPLEGNYTWAYKLKSANGVHTYMEFTETWIGEGFLGEWVEDYAISIHPDGKDDWTFIYYFAGDNDLTTSMDLEVDKLTNKAPDGEFKAYILFDRDTEDDHTSYYKPIWTGGRKWDIEVGRGNGIDMGDIWSSSGYTLRSFMDWVTYCSPSGHYALIMNDHGKGYKGMCLENDIYYMATNEIRDTLKEFKRDRRELDVLVLSACGMSTIEAIARFSPYTEYIVAPQQPTYSGHGLCTEKVLQNLKQYDWVNSPPGAFSVATDFVNGFIQESGGTRYDSTICMIDTEDMMDLADQLNLTFKAIYENWELLGECFSNAFGDTTRIPGPELGEFENGDMKEFLELLRDELMEFFFDPTGRSVLNKVQECISMWDDIVIYLHAIDGLNGINLYMPTEPVPTSVYVFMDWDYDGIYYRLRDEYRYCLRRQSGWEPYEPDDDEDDFTPLDPVDGHIIDDDGNGLGNRVVINLTPEQDDGQQPVYRVVLDCYQFSGNGGGYLSDMLKKRIILDQDDIDGITQIETTLPVFGWYTIIARVLDEDNEIVQKFIAGNYSMEGTKSEGDPPSLNITASDTRITVGNEISLEAVISNPDGDEIDIVWDLDHRDGISFDSFDEEISTRYLKPGNVTITCTVTDGEHTVVETIDIVVDPAVGNKAPTAGMSSEVDEYGVVTLSAGALSYDPDEDMLYYKFNFGDGNWTDWIEDDHAKHHYSQIGTYNCSVRVMDIRGAVSNRSFQLIDVETVKNITGEVDDDDDESEEISQGIIIAIMVVSALILLAVLAVLVIIVKVRKKDEDVSDNEEEETW